jgi:hypothetical protein
MPADGRKAILPFRFETDPAGAVLSTINPPVMRRKRLITKQIFLDVNTFTTSIFT